MKLLLLIILVLWLVFFHELGHVISAKLLRLSIQKIGLQFKPYPHFYVAVEWPKNVLHKYIYLFSGTFITILLFCASIYNGFFESTILFWAFVIQFAIELNPFYSDFSIAMVLKKKPSTKENYAINYQRNFSKFQYTLGWYVHFIIWASYILLLINSKSYML